MTWPFCCLRDTYRRVQLFMTTDNKRTVNTTCGERPIDQYMR
jgi:hypothetical protein